MSDEVPDQEAWDAWHPTELAQRIAGIDRPWCVVGGWALDLWHGRETRAHEDLEFTVLREDFDRFREVLAGGDKVPLWPAGHLPHKGGEDSRPALGSIRAPTERLAEPLPLVGRGWGGALSDPNSEACNFTFYTAIDGVLALLPDGAPLPADAAQIWLWDITAACWRVDIMIEPGTPDVWVCKRDPAITQPRNEIVRLSESGVPYLGPAAILLLKAKHQRPKDEADFEMALPMLGADEKAWLKNCLTRLYPGHAWLARL